MKEKQKELIVCPQCGSTDLRWLLGGSTGDQYKCPNCNYQGIALKGNIKFIKELKKGLALVESKKKAKASPNKAKAIKAKEECFIQAAFPDGTGEN